jgi:ankyrin repeat protein
VLAALAATSTICVGPAALYVFDAVYWQWSTGYGWASVLNPHGGPFVMLFYLSWFGSVVLLVVLWVLRARNARVRAVPQLVFTAWILILLGSAMSFLPSRSLYAAVAVLLLGPGNQATYLQREAANRDSVTLLNALMIRGARLDSDLLGFAASRDSPSVVRRLIQGGAPVNERHFESQNTALHSAVDQHEYQIAELLVQAGARSDIPNARGKTAMDLAKERNDLRMVEILSSESSPRKLRSAS